MATTGENATVEHATVEHATVENATADRRSGTRATPSSRAAPHPPSSTTRPDAFRMGADPADPAEPAEPADPHDPADPADPADPRDPVGLYGPSSVAWRLNREATLLLGAGPRALLMQIAHPLIAEGVDQHSDFRADPWRRLRGTLRSYLAIVYGTTTTARAEIRRLNELHRRVGGPVRDPLARAASGADAYSARDPVLSLWVHATLIDATIVAHDAWIRPLDRDDRARFYAETRPIGRAFGIPDAILPADIDAFEAYLEAQLGTDGPIQVTPTARELARTILAPPLGPLHPALAVVPAPLYAWTLWPAIALLPPRIREAYGLSWGPRERLVAAWLTSGFRAWRPVLPPPWRTMPQALAADARLASTGARVATTGARVATTGARLAPADARLAVTP